LSTLYSLLNLKPVTLLGKCTELKCWIVTEIRWNKKKPESLCRRWNGCWFSGPGYSESSVLGRLCRTDTGICGGRTGQVL